MKIPEQYGIYRIKMHWVQQSVYTCTAINILQFSNMKRKKKHREDIQGFFQKISLHKKDVIHPTKTDVPPSYSFTLRSTSSTSADCRNIPSTLVPMRAENLADSIKTDSNHLCIYAFSLKMLTILQRYRYNLKLENLLHIIQQG